MKNFIYVAVIALCMAPFWGCKSKEEKAEILIKDYMFKHLYDFESYEIVETKVDSCYTSLFKDPEIRHAALQAKKYLDQSTEYRKEQEYAENTMDIWSDSWSSYSRKRYKEAREEYKEASINLSKSFKSHNENLLIIKNKSINFESEFIGWEVNHSFRCKNRGGNFSLGNYLFIIDKNFTKIINVIDDDEDNDTILVFIGLATGKSKEEIEESILSSTKAIEHLESMH
ncbi:MAG: hypothetical protein IJW42_02820 [Alistipes sp.]|nr:hypothetical protein [Alistipes sp.]